MPLNIVILPIDAHPRPCSPESVRAQRAAARRALRRCADGCGAPSEGWIQNAAGAPLPNGRFHWSISHTRGYAAAAIADVPVGIDVEAVVPRRRRLDELVAHSCEWSLLPDASWDSFYRMWTAKEAVLKACGSGIAHLLECRLMKVSGDVQRWDGRRKHLPYRDAMMLQFAEKEWHVRQFAVNAHLIAVACPADDCDENDELRMTNDAIGNRQQAAGSKHQLQNERHSLRAFVPSCLRASAHSEFTILLSRRTDHP